ncbi:serine hydrolase domain-containing protein [Streptomyces sp. NPDC051577]|uniref:serine hydrolase domain-containing protein n=1 Tax=Streptomyces sp. NPDC051577 TaxID=3155166 RepID=UPI003427D32E
MNATTRTLIATALVLGIAAGPAAAHATPTPATGSGTGPSSARASTPASASASGPTATRSISTPPNAAALRQSIAGLGADHPYATGAVVRVSGSSGSRRGGSGVSDVRTGAPVIDDGRFRAGSVTKTFTAAVVLQLAAERRIDLDRPIQRYLPGTFPAAFDPITVRELLNHTSGIRAADGPGNAFQDQWDHRFDVTDPHAQIANALAKGPESDPGEFQHYLNINYTVLGVLIEKVTGTTYERAVDERILRPLGLRQTSFPGRTRTHIPGRHNIGYQALPLPDGTTELRDVSVWNQSDRWAAGDLISSTADLERFTRALFAGRVVPPPAGGDVHRPRGVRVRYAGQARAADGRDAEDGPGGRSRGLRQDRRPSRLQHRHRGDQGRVPALGLHHDLQGRQERGAEQGGRRDGHGGDVAVAAERTGRGPGRV